MRIHKITEDDIVRYLRSLGKDASVKPKRKKAAMKKLQELRARRPGIICIIEERALELLASDEENFRDGLKPFVGDYIAFGDKIRQAGITDDTTEFYKLFKIITRDCNKIIDEHAVGDGRYSAGWRCVRITSSYIPLTPELLYKAFLIKLGYGDLMIRFKPGYTEDSPSQEDFVSTVETEFVEPSLGILPLTKLGELESVPVLFLDINIDHQTSSTGADFFKDALTQLKTNKNNTPVILLTRETKDSIEDKLGGLDLKDVQFKTLAELGLSTSEWYERSSYITDVNGLNCIPLTRVLCKIYKDLQKARDKI